MNVEQNSSVVASRNSYGINAHAPDKRILGLIADAGIRWVRMDFNWYEIEPKVDGKFNYTRINTAVDLAMERGLFVFATLGYTPQWAGSGSTTNSSRWARFVSNTVSRFKGRIIYWGMWNEPNGKEFWAGTPEDYRKLILIPGARAARDANNECKVVGPDIVCFGDWPDQIKRILEGEAKNCIDVFSCHIYKEKGADSAIEMFEHGERNAEESDKLGWKPGTAIRAVMQDAGLAANMPLWLTETGWNTKPSPRLEAISEEEQAKRYIKICRAMFENDRQQWWHKTFFYEMKDDPVYNHAHPDKPFTFGILDANLRRRKAYDAYAEYLHSLPS